MTDYRCRKLSVISPVSQGSTSSMTLDFSTVSMYKFLLILFVFCAANPLRLHAQISTVAISAEFALAPSTTVIAAEPYQLVITLISTEPVHLSSFTVADSENFLIQKLSIFEPLQLSIDFVPLTAGFVQFPSVQVLSETQNGSSQIFVCPELRMNILPGTKALSPSSLKDIKGPLGNAGFPWFWALFSAVLMAAAAAGFYFYHRKKQKIEQEKQMELILPAHEIALKKLAEQWQKYEESRDFKPFYFEISMIFRAYLSKEFSIDALEKTTPEIFSVMRARSIDRKLCVQCRDLLAACDLVKFAKFIFTESEIEANFLSIKQFIEERAALIKEPRKEPNKEPSAPPKL